MDKVYMPLINDHSIIGGKRAVLERAIPIFRFDDGRTREFRVIVHKKLPEKDKGGRDKAPAKMEFYPESIYTRVGADEAIANISTGGTAEMALMTAMDMYQQQADRMGVYLHPDSLERAERFVAKMQDLGAKILTRCMSTSAKSYPKSDDWANILTEGAVDFAPVYVPGRDGQFGDFEPYLMEVNTAGRENVVIGVRGLSEVEPLEHSKVEDYRSEVEKRKTWRDRWRRLMRGY